MAKRPKQVIAFGIGPEIVRPTPDAPYDPSKRQEARYTGDLPADRQRRLDQRETLRNERDKE